MTVPLLEPLVGDDEVGTAADHEDRGTGVVAGVQCRHDRFGGGRGGG